MNTISISIAFTRESDSSLLVKSREILAQLDGNPAFPNLQPPVEEVREYVNAFESALLAAADGGRQKTALKNDAREILVINLRAWARHVEVAARGEMSKVLSSGFVPHKERQRAGILPSPGEVLLKPTAVAGQIAVRLSPVANAAAYELQTNTSGDLEAGWMGGGAYTSSRITLNGLLRGSIFWVRARSLGAAGPGPWSAPASVQV